LDGIAASIFDMFKARLEAVMTLALAAALGCDSGVTRPGGAGGGTAGGTGMGGRGSAGTVGQAGSGG